MGDAEPGPPVLQRTSGVTTESADSELARFTSVRSWVSHQSWIQDKKNRRELDSGDPAVPPVPQIKRKPVGGVENSNSNSGGRGNSRSSAETTDTVFRQHPGTKVEVPGLKGKRIKSAVLDRHVWGRGTRVGSGMEFGTKD
jgi:hypothetical protein